MYSYSFFIIYKKEKPARSLHAGFPEILVRVSRGLLVALTALEIVDDSLEGQTAKGKCDDNHDNSNPVAKQVLCRCRKEIHNDSGEPIQTLADIVAGKTDQGYAGNRTEHVLSHPPNKLSKLFHNVILLNDFS